MGLARRFTIADAPTHALPESSQHVRSLKGAAIKHKKAALDSKRGKVFTRNCTVSEIPHMFDKNGGNLDEQGSVGCVFDRKSQIVIEKGDRM